MDKTTILSALLLASPICAQFTVTTVASDFTVTNPTQTASAPGVLAEPTYLQVGAPGPLTDIARLAYEVDDTNWPNEKVIWISASSLAASWFHIPNGPSMSESLASTITLTANQPTLVDIHAELTHLHQGPIPTSSALLDVGALGSMTLGDAPATFSATVDSNGFVMNYDASNFMPWPASHISGVHSHVILKLTLKPMAVQSVGAACNGATLTCSNYLGNAADVLAAHPTATVGLLIIGTAAMDTPLSQIIGVDTPCPLRTDPLFAVPFTILQATGERHFDFTPPPGAWRLQLLTADDSGLSASNALQFQN
ncbi:MAG: hypothetical protein KDB80_18395 [Planctomycetes bacterium]|nr:hypothetical protein [Planctomycetota bacterium]